MKTKHEIIIGDSRKMAEVADDSVHLIVTSPPYWQLKDYDSDFQIGFDDTYESYINHLNLVWKECSRILQPGCRMIINIGDQFARSVYYGRYKVIPIRTEIIRFAEAIGFDYMGAIIWQKKTTMNTSGGATVMGSYPFPRNGVVEIDYEFILIFKKSGKSPIPGKEIKEKSKLTKDEWKEYFSGHWSFGGGRQNKHLAVFPEELPKRLIKMFTFVGDTVLDPFLGSGTTALAARNLERNSIGYEISRHSLPIIKEKINIDDRRLFMDYEVGIVEQSLEKVDWDTEIEQLPYSFKDPVKFDKKIDPREQMFGSKVNHSDPNEIDYYSVKEIISPELMLLNDGTIIRLIGIKEDPKRLDESFKFLKKKLSGQKVFLKYDKQMYDDENNLLCYLYLKNKTFINAHLIKNRLVFIDESTDFKKKKIFRKYLGQEE